MLRRRRLGQRPVTGAPGIDMNEGAQQFRCSATQGCATLMPHF